MAGRFEFLPLRFQFQACDPVVFPPGESGNILRGAFGTIFRKLVCDPRCHDAKTCPVRDRCPYARVFEPRSAGGGPSGLADWPRPFVFRAHHLDGCRIAPGETFHFDLHMFAVREPWLAYFVESFARLAREGLGPGRGRAVLERVERIDLEGRPSGLLRETAAPLVLDLSADPPPVSRILVRFTTPTELKSGSSLASQPEFDILFARIRDRLSTLGALYGAGPLEIDFKELGRQASQVCMVRSNVRHVASKRRSSKTGQVHPTGGFVGEAEYQGDIAEFMPFLRAARWTGVGRQTVWGKGALEITALEP